MKRVFFRLRAAERAGALLTLFDNDGDGCLSFDEFRGKTWELYGFGLNRGRHVYWRREALISVPFTYVFG